MEKQFEFEKRADFSRLLGKQKIIDFSVDANGHAVVLAVAPGDVNLAQGRRESKGFASFALSKARSHYPATFIRFDGREVRQQTVLHEVEVAFPSGQPLANGEILLVGGRCEFRDGNPEQNATVYDGNGHAQRQFVLGDGIQHTQTTEEGLIWVSYFDEGVFGNYGWAQPMGAAGLNCFDSGGHIVWPFTPPDGFDSICDCYAMNVAKDAVWVCYYTEFPLVKIDTQRRTSGWKNGIRGASALAVGDRSVVLWGGYEDEKTRCVVQNFSETGLVGLREIKLGLPDQIPFPAAKVIGRGSALHALVGNSWFSFDVRQLES